MQVWTSFSFWVWFFMITGIELRGGGVWTRDWHAAHVQSPLRTQTLATLAVYPAASISSYSSGFLSIQIEHGRPWGGGIEWCWPEGTRVPWDGEGGGHPLPDLHLPLHWQLCIPGTGSEGEGWGLLQLRKFIVIFFITLVTTEWVITISDSYC